MKRKSLSASLGSWCVQLVYNPHRTPEKDARPNPVDSAATIAFSGLQKASLSNSSASNSVPQDFGGAPRFWPLYWPAFAALGINASAGCYALAHFLTLGPQRVYLFAVLLLAVAVSFGACSISGWIGKGCRRVRWPLLLSGLCWLITPQFHRWLLLDLDEANAIVAILVGAATILSILLVGVQSGNRCIPICAPLVPTLSLFGLLCLVCVDAEVQVCFVIFVASALYLLSYDRFVRLHAPSLSSGIVFQMPSPERSAASVLDPAATPKAILPSQGECRRWAKLSLSVSGLWFVLFMVGGALCYWPVHALLPRVFGAQLNQVRVATQGISDFRKPSGVMELRGGDHSLSEREVMRVTLHSGTTSGLWRGKVYEYYHRSRWEEKNSVRSNQDFYMLRQQHFRLRKAKRAIPLIPPHLGRAEHVVETIEPVNSGENEIYASGVPLSWSRSEVGALGLDTYISSLTGTEAAEAGYESSDSEKSYLIRSYVVRPKVGALSSLSGYESFERKNTNSRVVDEKTSKPLALASDDEVLRNLQQPEDPNTRRLIRVIAGQIKMGQRRALLTPRAKVMAINSFLSENYLYSLKSPPVPPTSDAVTFFLTESPQGACDMFASSTVLLLRAMNVPARLVTGYLQPESPLPSAKSSNKFLRPTWLVRERDAHAWVEYYVPQLGWIAYDPTSTTQTAETLPDQLLGFLEWPLFDFGVPIFVVALPLAGCALLAVGACWPRLEKRFHARKTFENDEMARQHIVSVYQNARRRMARRVPSLAHFTPHEYEAIVSRKPLPLAAKQEFAALTLLYISARYGETPKVSRADCAHCLRRLRIALKQKW